MKPTRKLGQTKGKQTKKNNFDGGALRMPKIFKKTSQVKPPDEQNKLANEIYSVVEQVKSRFKKSGGSEFFYVNVKIQEIFGKLFNFEPISMGKAGTIYIVKEKPKVYNGEDFEPFVLKTFAQPKNPDKTKEFSFPKMSFSINDLFDSTNVLKSNTKDIDEKPAGDSTISIFSSDLSRSVAANFAALQSIRHKENYDMVKYKYMDFQTCLADILMTFISFQKIYGINCELEYLQQSIREFPSLTVYDLDFNSFLSKFNLNMKMPKTMQGGNAITNNFPYNEVLIQQVLKKVIEVSNTEKEAENDRLIQFKDYFMERNPFNENKKTIWIVQNVCGISLEDGKNITTFNKLIRYLLYSVKEVRDLKQAGKIDFDIDVRKIIDIVVKITNEFFEFLNILKAYVNFQHTDLKNENIFVLFQEGREITSIDDLFDVKLVLADLDKSRIDYFYNKNQPDVSSHIINNLKIIKGIGSEASTVLTEEEVSSAEVAVDNSEVAADAAQDAAEQATDAAEQAAVAAAEADAAVAASGEGEEEAAEAHRIADDAADAAQDAAEQATDAAEQAAVAAAEADAAVAASGEGEEEAAEAHRIADDAADAAEQAVAAASEAADAAADAVAVAASGEREIEGEEENIPEAEQIADDAADSAEQAAVAADEAANAAAEADAAVADSGEGEEEAAEAHRIAEDAAEAAAEAADAAQIAASEAAAVAVVGQVSSPAAEEEEKTEAEKRRERADAAEARAAAAASEAEVGGSKKKNRKTKNNKHKNGKKNKSLKH